MATINIIRKGKDDLNLDVAPVSTIQDLKEAIDKKIGIVPKEQELYFLGYPLTEPTSQITELLEMSQNFNLVLQEEDADKSLLNARSPRGFVSDKEMWLITGGKFNFQSILLRANSEEWIKLKSNRFGVAQDIEGESDSRIFQVRIYESKKNGRISLRTVNKVNEVFLVADEGEEEPLRPIDTKKYDERKRMGRLDHAKKILPFLTALFALISAGANVAEAC